MAAAVPSRSSTIVIQHNHLRTDISQFEFNGKSFAFFHKSIDSNSLVLDLKDTNVVILAPVQCDQNVEIKADSIFLLAKVTSVAGKCLLKADNKLVSLIGKQPFASSTMVGHPSIYAEIENEDLRNIIAELSESGKTNPDGNKLLEGLMNCWAAVDDEGETYADALKFYGIPRKVERNPKLSHFREIGLNVNMKSSPFKEEFVPHSQVMIHLDNSPSCKKAYDTLSEDAKKLVSQKYVYNQFNAYFQKLTPQSQVSQKALIFFGAIDSSEEETVFPKTYSLSEVQQMRLTMFRAIMELESFLDQDEVIKCNKIVSKIR